MQTESTQMYTGMPTKLSEYHGPPKLRREHPTHHSLSPLQHQRLRDHHHALYIHVLDLVLRAAPEVSVAAFGTSIRRLAV